MKNDCYPDNCLEADGPTVCTLCKNPRFQIISGKCFLINPTIPENCNEWDKSFLCTQCADGYSLSGDRRLCTMIPFSEIPFFDCIAFKGDKCIECLNPYTEPSTDG